jgi:hypothetical protein
MHVEQMILTDLMEQVITERQIWNNLDNEVQMKTIALLADLMSRTIRNKHNTADGEQNERS